jgi:hypothetical protein
MGVIVWRDNRREMTVKGNNDVGWSSDDVVLWLGRRQNRDAVDWWGEWPRLRWPFYSSGGWKSSDPGRVTDGDVADSMFRFWLERGDDGTKRCRKMKRRQRSRFGSMGSKCDTTRRRDDINQRRGGTGEGKERRRRQLGWRESYWVKKIKKIHVVDSAVTNGR